MVMVVLTNRKKAEMFSFKTTYYRQLKSIKMSLAFYKGQLSRYLN